MSTSSTTILHPEVAEFRPSTPTNPSSRPIRIGFEGCGHGKLDDIYTAITARAHTRGWPSVDLVIIGGDFQSVRNPSDLTCMSVPQHYKALGDFPAYYAGHKRAPYLTLFVGGNHEASNYLSELYYGGWVAPNIYYMGAANVVNFGGLRIAGISGIWKGHDYRAPHHERLPYNADDVKSAYHLREVDVRKLLALRGQVDLVVSHDWPQGVELHADEKAIERLFRNKWGFREDSESGRLGSVAGRCVLERLRPRWWVSAHLHTKFEAVVRHGVYAPPPDMVRRRWGGVPLHGQGQGQVALGETREEWLERVKGEAERGKKEEEKQEQETKAETETVSETPPQEDPTTQSTTETSQTAVPTETADDTQSSGSVQRKLSAWNNFHITAAEAEQDTPESATPAGTADVDEENKDSDLNYQITWKKVETADEGEGLERKYAGVERWETKEQPLEGGEGKENVRPVKNEDEINLDMDGEDMEDGGMRVEVLDREVGGVKRARIDRGEGEDKQKNPDEINVDMESDAEVKEAAAKAQPATAVAEAKQEAAPQETAPQPQNPDEIDLDLDDEDKPAQPAPTLSATTAPKQETPEQPNSAPKHEPAPQQPDQPDLDPAIRAVLPPNTPYHVNPDGSVVQLTLPPEITNEVTHFMSLDKCEPKRHYVEVAEFVPGQSGTGFQQQPQKQEQAQAATDSNANADQTQLQQQGPADPIDEPCPFRLEYDPEWLAITKALAPELTFGLDATTHPVPPTKGDLGYLPSILAARRWVDEHIVRANRLAIPQNFAQTAPPIRDFSDPEQTRIPVGMRVEVQPVEYTNPQTVAYCEMLGIGNVFEASEGEREERRRAGPRECRPREFFGQRRRGGGGRGGRGKGRGGGGNRGGRRRGGARGGGDWGQGQGRGGGDGGN